MKLVKACIAMAAFAALFVVPSVASAIQLTSPTGTTAPVGTLIQGTNVAHSKTSVVTVMTTGAGNIECAKATLTGELTKNAANGAIVEGNVTTASFSGTPSEPASAHCTAPGGFGTTTVTPSHTSDTKHEYAAGKESTSLPWCIKAEAEDVFTVRGGKCSEESRPLVFSLHTTLLGTCTYSKASVSGTYTTHPNAAIVTISGQEFTQVTGSAFCPPTGKLDMAFTLETDPASGSPSDVYIDLK